MCVCVPPSRRAAPHQGLYMNENINAVCSVRSGLSRYPYQKSTIWCTYNFVRNFSKLLICYLIEQYRQSVSQDIYSNMWVYVHFFFSYFRPGILIVYELQPWFFCACAPEYMYTFNIYIQKRCRRHRLQGRGLLSVF